MDLKFHIRVLIFAAVFSHLQRVSSEEVKNPDNEINDRSAPGTSQLPDSTDERFSSLGELLSSLQGFNLNTNLQTQINQIEDIEIMTTIKKKVQFDASVLQNQQLNMAGQGIIPQQQFQNQLPNNLNQQGSTNNTNQIRQYPNQGGLGNNPVGLNSSVINGGGNQFKPTINNQNPQLPPNPSSNFSQEKHHQNAAQNNQNLQNSNLETKPNINKGGQTINKNEPHLGGNVNNGAMQSQDAFVNNNKGITDRNTNKVTQGNARDQQKNVLPSNPGSTPNDNYYRDTIFFMDDDYS